MHEMQTIVTDDRGVGLSACLSRGSTRRRTQCVRSHSVQLLPNHFGLLLYVIPYRLTDNSLAFDASTSDDLISR